MSGCLSFFLAVETEHLETSNIPVLTNHTASKNNISVIEDNGLPRGDSPLRSVKYNFNGFVRKNGGRSGLFGLLVSDFCLAPNGTGRRSAGDPVKIIGSQVPLIDLAAYSQSSGIVCRINCSDIARFGKRNS